MSLEALKAELDQVQYALKQARYDGNTEMARQLEEKEAQIVADIVEKEQNGEEVQTTIEYVTNDEPFTITVGGQTINLRDFGFEEETYQALKIAVGQKLIEAEVQHQANIENLTSLKDQQISAYKSQVEAAHQTAESKYNDYEEVIAKLTLEIKDKDSKLSAAAEEVDTLRVRVKELEALKEKPTVATNLEPGALAEAIRAANAKKPAIYDYIDDGVKSTAKLLETDEEIVFNSMYVGKYRIADAEEVQRFREERARAEEEARQLADSIPEVVDEGVKIPEAFQSEDGVSEPRDETVQDLHVEGTNGGVESLEARVTELEGTVKRLSEVVADLVSAPEVAA